MRGLKILNLANNRQLGWTANLEGLWSLNQLYLSHTETATFPTNADQLANLARIDLHSNQISTLPEYAYQQRERIILHDNPLSAATRVRLGLDAPLGEHVTVLEGQTLWLHDTPAAARAARVQLWSDVAASPGSAAFFTVLADTTRCAEYRSATARAQLTVRVWDMLEAAGERQQVANSCSRLRMTDLPAVMAACLNL
nr:NEL-type E3 ubiquitin ligase domain-containing protein [Pseudomonas kitaguniensis]